MADLLKSIKSLILLLSDPDFSDEQSVPHGRKEGAPTYATRKHFSKMPTAHLQTVQAS